MDRFEVRRLALKALVDDLGRGGRAEVAKRIGKEASYVSRLLYPPGKEGRKRIGDELVEAITRVYPDWLSRSQAAPAVRPKQPPSAGFVAFDAVPTASPQVIERLELAALEVQRRLGYLPEPGRIQIVTQHGASMRPTLDEGDLVFIDTSVSQFAGDDCYLVAMGDDLQVKLLQRRGADVWVVSQNPDFPPWRITEDTDVSIRGRAVLRANLRPI